LDLKAQMADVTSHLGNLAEQTRDLAGAARHYGDQVAQLEGIRSADPKNTRWRYNLATALGLHAVLLAVTGQLPAAQQRFADARALMEALIAYESTNQRWRMGMVIANLNEADVAKASGSTQRALQLVESAHKTLEEVIAAEPSDRVAKHRLATAWRLEAELRHALGRPDAAATSARALEIGEKRIQSGQAVAIDRVEYAQARLIAGRIASAQGDPVTALRHWQRAREELAPFVAKSKRWWILDPAVRVAALMGLSEEKQALISQLDQLGYVPLEPWPGPDLSVVTNNK